MRVLGVVPARGGSKGVPGKNIRLFCGKPLLQYTAECARASHTLTRVVLSTDDEEIARMGRQCGLDVPFMRPRELAGDDTPTLAVVRHALGWLEERGDRFEAVCLLQPTTPLRRPEWVDACVRLLESQPDVDAVVSVLPVPTTYNPHWVYFQGTDGALHLSTGEMTPIARRQDLPVAVHRDGAVYVTRRDVIMKQESLYGSRLVGHITDSRTYLNLDTPDDWRRGEALVSQLAEVLRG
jgi:CMP-N-acetylneuraminic acid synthetase